MQATNDALLSKQYIEELHENILCAKDEMRVAEQLYISAEEAYNAAKNLQDILNDCSFVAEAQSVERLMSKLSRILSFRETEFEIASEVYRDFMRDLDQEIREQANVG